MKKFFSGIFIFMCVALLFIFVATTSPIAEKINSELETAETTTEITLEKKEATTTDAQAVENKTEKKIKKKAKKKENVSTEAETTPVIKETEIQEDTTTPAGSTLQIHYIDVGQGDCTLVTCDGQSMLIDAGGNDKGTAVQMYLIKQNISTLDYVIGTHPDEDHVGGLDVVITKFDCKTILLTDEQKDTATYRDVLSAITYKAYNKTTPVVGTEYSLGGSTFQIVAPASLGGDSNNNSIAIVLRHGNNKFYFEGDAEEDEESSILASGYDISANVYKIGHHGSKTSTSDAMLNRVNPAFAVISVGAGNSYGHPNAETLNKLRAKGVQVFRTDEQGSVIATSDGNSITWNCSPSESWMAGEPTGSSAVENINNQIVVPETTTVQNAGSSEGVMVHVTNTGMKYHLAGCQYLADSDIEITLEEAKSRGLTPCSRCNPPQ